MPAQATFVGFFLFYLFALLLEAVCFFRKRWYYERLTLAVVSTGAVAQFIFLLAGFFGENERLFPGIGVWFFLFSWMLVLFLLYYYIFYHKKNFGLFFLPFILFMIFAACYLDKLNFSAATEGQFLRAFHGLTFLLASLFVLMGFITGCMYFLQYRQLGRITSSGLFARLSLPSLEWLMAANRRSVKLSLICLAMGIFSGFWLDYKGASLSSDAVVYPLLDPMVFGAIILFVLLFGFLLLQKLTPWCQAGTTVALLTIACFLFLVAVISVGVVRNTHWIRLSDVNDVEAVEGESEPANDFGEKNGLPGEEAAP